MKTLSICIYSFLYPQLACFIFVIVSLIAFSMYIVTISFIFLLSHYLLLILNIFVTIFLIALTRATFSSEKKTQKKLANHMKHTDGYTNI